MYCVAFLLALVCMSVDGVHVVGKKGGCCLPQKMEMLEGMVLGKVVKGVANVTLGRFYVAMDQKKKMVFANITLVEGGNETGMMVLQDFPNKVQYIINGTNCTKAPLEAWTKKCIPAGAMFVGSAYLGHAGGINGVPVNTYMITNSTNVAYVSVTQEHRCIPVMETAYGQSNGVPYTATITFANSTNSVSNPHIFDVPTLCKRPNVTTVAQHHPVIRSILF